MHSWSRSGVEFTPVGLHQGLAFRPAVASTPTYLLLQCTFSLSAGEIEVFVQPCFGSQINGDFWAAVIRSKASRAVVSMSV